MKSPTFNHLYIQEKPDNDTRERLRDYLVSSEREEPLVFVGRQDIRDYVQKKIEHLRRANKSFSSTIVVQGAPGAGKTSLSKIIAKDMASDNELVVVSLPPAVFSDPASVLQGFISHEHVDFPELSRSHGRQGGGTLDAKVLKLNGPLSSQLPSLAAMVEKSPTNLWGFARTALTAGKELVFLLLVDEAQRLGVGEDVRAEQTVLSALHDGDHLADLKILPVFLGLSDTDTALSRVGITREAQDIFALGPLSHEESMYVVVSTIRELGVEMSFKDEDIDRLGYQIGFACDGWPRHIHNYLQALVSEMEDCLEHGKTYLDLDKVLDEGHDNRIRFYSRRLSRIVGYDDLHKSLDLLAMKYEMNAEMGKADVFDHFMQATRNDRDVGNGMITECVHNGILQKFENGNYGFSIPSLQAFLANGRDVEKTKEQLRKKVDEETGRVGAPDDGHMQGSKGGRFD